MSIHLSRTVRLEDELWDTRVIQGRTHQTVLASTPFCDLRVVYSPDNTVSVDVR